MTNRYILMLTLLVTGNLIGAGILGMPITTGLAGFWPSMLMMVLFALGMLFSAVVLANEANTTQNDTFNYPSLYQKYLGTSGKWVATIANLIILYGLLTGYLAGGSQIIVNIVGIPTEFQPLVLLTLFALLTLLSISGMSVIQKYNTVLMLSLWTAFFVLIFVGFEKVESAKYAYTDWGYLPMAIPMIVTGFHFHNIIPSLCKDSKWSKDIWKPIAIGMGIGFAMNTIWMLVAIGVVPTFGEISLNEARVSGIPITVEMSQILHSQIFSIIGMIFAIIAITTSYVANGMGLKDFTEDFLKNSLNIENKWIILAVAFIPPLILSLLFADIFLEAINIAGGIGIVLLFGILPSIIFYKKTSSKFGKIISIISLIAFSVALIIVTLQTFHILHIEPHM
ncbi:MAG: aromatic amino acid transport family protein [Campylobacterota bacterium]|nr:aromatic amino acid transport family protein [Campylobacterota bacterium]